MVRDLDLVQFAGDAQRLEVVADGLSLFGGAQLAIDTTLVSALHANGEPPPRMVSPWSRPAAEKRGRTRSLWASAHARVSWCLGWKLVGGGLERHKSS